MLKVAIVGMGIRGKMYANTLAQDDRVKVASVCDVNSSALTLSKQLSETCVYNNFERMLDEQKPDAVIISTPDFLHKDVIVGAADRGIHMLVEKPLAIALDEAEEIRKALEKSNSRFMIGFENRWNMPFVNIKNSIDAGNIGKIVTMNSRLNDTIFVPTQMIGWSSKTSPAWFLLSHSVDLGCWFTGRKVAKVYATGIKSKLIGMGIDTYDSILSCLTFDDGAIATYTTSWILPESMPMVYDFKYEIIGTEGVFYVNLQDQTVQLGGKKYLHSHVLGTPVSGRLTASPELMVLEFIDRLLSDKKFECGIKEAYGNVVIIDSIHKSIRSGSPEEVCY